jgi:ABC-2 type transport system permease protein
MREFVAFTKKEFMEQLRAYKCLVVFAVFFLFGMASPVLAKLLPEFISSVDMQGIKLIIPDPTAMDAYIQFFKNMQLCIVVILLVFGGSLSGELVKGTLINVLAKGLSRDNVILSKYFAAAVLWTVSYLLSALTTYGYTVYLFGDANYENLVFSFFCLWLFGCFVLALIFLSSTLAAGNFGGLVLSAGAIIIMMMANILPKTEKFNPVTLASKNTALLDQSAKVSDLLVTVGFTGILTVGCIIVSIVLFRRKRL